MTVPSDTRAKYVAEHYLDSINKPNKVELKKFIKIENKDIDNSAVTKYIKSDPVKTDSEKQKNRKWLKSINDINTPNGFFCDYKTNGIEYGAIIKLDAKLLKVVGVTELHN